MKLLAVLSFVFRSVIVLRHPYYVAPLRSHLPLSRNYHHQRHTKKDHPEEQRALRRLVSLSEFGADQHARWSWRLGNRHKRDGWARITAMPWDKLWLNFESNRALAMHAAYARRTLFALTILAAPEKSLADVLPMLRLAMSTAPEQVRRKLFAAMRTGHPKRAVQTTSKNKPFPTKDADFPIAGGSGYSAPPQTVGGRGKAR